MTVLFTFKHASQVALRKTSTNILLSYKRVAAAPKKAKTEPSRIQGLRAVWPPVSGRDGVAEAEEVPLVVPLEAAVVAAAELVVEEEAAEEVVEDVGAGVEAAADEVVVVVAAGVDTGGVDDGEEEAEEEAAGVVVAVVEAGATAAVAAQEHTASADEMTARPVWIPQAARTQPWAADWMAAD